MDPVKLANNFKGIMERADANIINYVIASKIDCTFVDVLTTKEGLESLASKFSIDVKENVWTASFSNNQNDRFSSIEANIDGEYRFSAYHCTYKAPLKDE